MVYCHEYLGSPQRSPSGRASMHGFTMIEVLLVVVIIAVLAGTVIPRFLTATDDAKQCSLKHSLHLLETQIELYRVQHLNRYPQIITNGLPQLTSSTNALGEIGAAGPAFPFGPYILEAPMNPYDGSRNVVAVAVAGAKPSSTADGLGGWQYDATNGTVWPNNPEAYK
jgi:prepilin-type N-terminal cleavage/methylation domain-containing protein